MEAAPDSVVYIGSKPVMNYVLACLTLLQNGNKEIRLKARGRAISRAVDTAEILSNKYAPDLVVKRIEIDTEQLGDGSGRTSSVSSMQILLAA